MLRFFVTLQRDPGTVTIDADWFGTKHFLDNARRPAGQPKRGEKAERNGLSVRQTLVADRRLEGVRERVPEVEDCTAALIEGIS